MACKILVPQARTGSSAWTVEVPSPIHWTTRKVPPHSVVLTVKLVQGQVLMTATGARSCDGENKLEASETHGEQVPQQTCWQVPDQQKVRGSWDRLPGATSKSRERREEWNQKMELWSIRTLSPVSKKNRERERMKKTLRVKGMGESIVPKRERQWLPDNFQFLRTQLEFTFVKFLWIISTTTKLCCE